MDKKSTVTLSRDKIVTIGRNPTILCRLKKKIRSLIIGFKIRK